MKHLNIVFCVLLSSGLISSAVFGQGKAKPKAKSLFAIDAKAYEQQQIENEKAAQRRLQIEAAQPGRGVNPGVSSMYSRGRDYEHANEVKTINPSMGFGYR